MSRRYHQRRSNSQFTQLVLVVLALIGGIIALCALYVVLWLMNFV